MHFFLTILLTAGLMWVVNMIVSPPWLGQIFIGIYVFLISAVIAKVINECNRS